MTYHSVKRRNIKSLANFLVVMGISLLLLYLSPLLKDELWYYLKQLKSQDYKLFTDAPSTAVKDSVFARFLSTRPISITPVNQDFSIVIEKIGVNAPIVEDVPVTNQEAYIEALKKGVAHASVSVYPSKKPGNVYLFAHASLNFWTLGKYSTVFNLLGKMSNDDRIHIFYHGNTYVYSVVNKEIVKGWNTYPITRAVIEPTLTLQTCDPPGTTLNRLVVTAKLIDVKGDIQD